MGNNCSSELRELNLCELSSCVTQTLRVIPKDMTDLFYLQFDQTIGIAKVSVNSDSFLQNKEVVMPFFTPEHQTDDYFFMLHRKLQGLEYEALVYGSIINQLIVDKASPFFHKAHGVTYNCEYESLYNMFTVQPMYNPYRQTIVKLNMVEQFNNPARVGLVENVRMLTRDLAPKLQRLDPQSELGFNVLLLDVDVSFSKMLKGMLESVLRNPSTIVVILQVALACYALECSQLAHNNLSLSLITAVQSRSKTTVYQVNNNVYKVPSEFIVLLNDFSQAYSPKLGHNPNSPTDVFCRGRDFLCFMKDVYKNHTLPDEKLKLVSILAANAEAAQSILQLLNSPEPVPFPPGGFPRLRSLEEIIGKLTSSLQLTLPSAVKKVDYVLLCEERMVYQGPSSRDSDLKQQIKYLQRDLQSVERSVRTKQNLLMSMGTNSGKRTREPFDDKSDDEGSAKRRRTEEEFDVNQFLNL